MYFAEVLLTMPFLLLLTASQLFDLTHSDPQQYVFSRNNLYSFTNCIAFLLFLKFVSPSSMSQYIYIYMSMIVEGSRMTKSVVGICSSPDELGSDR